MQELTICHVVWDHLIPGDLNLHDKIVLKEIMLSGEIKFPRALMEEDTNTEDLMLIGFGDGGKLASCAAIY